MYVSLSQGEAKVYTKRKRKWKGLAKGDARDDLRRHDSGCWHLNAFPFRRTEFYKQMRIPKEAAPKKGRNE